MRLSPTEVLRHLGFDVPEDGIEINPGDAFIVTSALRLAGESISIDGIPEAKLTELHHGLAAIVSGWSKSGAISSLHVNEEVSEERLLKLRSTLQALLQVTCRRVNRSAWPQAMNPVAMVGSSGGTNAGIAELAAASSHS